MTFDVNAYLGPFAFRKLRHNTADALLRLMDAKGIDRAAVSSAAAITYRNTQPANEDLFEEVKGRRDRVVPFAVINPAYAGWEDDLKICRETFGMAGLRLYPNWHGYALSDPRCLELVRRASAMGMVVSIPVRVEDPRQRSWLIDVPDVPLDALAALAKACPDGRFLFLNGIGYARSTLGKPSPEMPANYKIDFPRLTALVDDEFTALYRSLGPGRLVFGTNMPFSVPDAPLLKLEVLDAPREAKERIRGGNAAEWLPAGG